MRIALIAGVLLYGAAVTVLWAFQRDLMYFPDGAPRVPPSHYAMLDGVGEITLTTADGVELAAWYAPAPQSRPTVVLFHGNGGSLRRERYRLKHFMDAGFGVLLLAYRGYSGNGGTPTEEGLYADARAALAWLEASGVAGTSTVDVAAVRFPIVPVTWLMEDRFESLARIGAITEPLLVMHGDRDFVIPQHLGRRLFDAANAPKEGFWPQGLGHNDIFDNGGFDAAVDFIRRTMNVPMTAPAAASGR